MGKSQPISACGLLSKGLFKPGDGQLCQNLQIAWTVDMVCEVLRGRRIDFWIPKGIPLPPFSQNGLREVHFFLLNVRAARTFA